MGNNLLASLALISLMAFPSAAPQAAAPAGQPVSNALKNRFIGTWKLVNTEQRNAKGEVIAPTATAPSQRTGYLIYDAAGYMAVSIMPISRQKYADTQPTGDEAKAAI